MKATKADSSELPIKMSFVSHEAWGWTKKGELKKVRIKRLSKPSHPSIPTASAKRRKSA